MDVITIYHAQTMQKKFCLWGVMTIHTILSSLLCFGYINNYDKIATALIIAIPLGWLLWMYDFFPRNLKAWWINLEREIKLLRKSPWKILENFGNIYLHFFWTVLLSGLLYVTALIGEHYLGWYTLPNKHDSGISIWYLLASVPGQQLLYFIWPRILVSKFIPNNWILPLICIVQFGILHNYYPGLATPALAAYTLGIPSAVANFYFKDPYAAIFSHMAIGSFAIHSGLV